MGRRIVEKISWKLVDWRSKDKWRTMFANDYCDRGLYDGILHFEKLISYMKL